jgi:3D (Asp-Asp-Asp) domain-containing protein
VIFGSVWAGSSQGQPSVGYALRTLFCLGTALVMSSCVLPEGGTYGGGHPRQMCVRTTAYTHTEAGGAKNAIGTRLRFGSDVSSAASDWSWMPVGTRFRVKETGRVYVIEDYGSALVGKQTIDLYLPNEPMMRAWGVRQVNIEILEWGSPAMSRMLLTPRRGSSYVNRMILAMDAQEKGGRL